jgi:hypothetical protein
VLVLSDSGMVTGVSAGGLVIFTEDITVRERARGAPTTTTGPSKMISNSCRYIFIRRNLSIFAYTLRRGEDGMVVYELLEEYLSPFLDTYGPKVTDICCTANSLLAAVDSDNSEWYLLDVNLRSGDITSVYNSSKSFGLPAFLCCSSNRVFYFCERGIVCCEPESSGAELWVEPASDVAGMCVSGNQYLYVCYRDNRMEIRNQSDGKSIKFLNSGGNKFSFEALCISCAGPEGQLFAYSSDEKSIAIISPSL